MRFGKLLIAAAVLVVCASTANAAMNIRQNGDGTADWVGAIPDAPQFSNCVGSVQLGTDIALTGPVVTYSLMSPITNAVIRNIQAAIPRPVGSSTSLATITVFAGSRTNFPVRWATGISLLPSGLVTEATIRLSGQGPSLVYFISSNAQAGPAGTMLVSNTVERNTPILVQVSPNFAVSTISGQVSITLCPR